MRPKKISVLAPGLIGGSVALAAARAFPQASLFVWSRNQSSLVPVQRSLPQAQAGTDLAGVAGSDFVILGAPAPALPEITRALLPHLSTTTLITDVASVKATVEQKLGPLLHGRARWIGSHPMAGSEDSGFSSARADLFQGAAVILTPTNATPASTTDEAAGFWSSLGGRILRMTAEEHDRRVAQISHLPHAVAAVLVRTAGTGGLAVAGPGYRDTTRVAAGPAALWAEILLANRDEVLTALGEFHAGLRDLERLLQEQNIRGLAKFLDEAAGIRHNLSHP